MHQDQEPRPHDYPHGRGYGHDYMRGGEVLGGYGYKDRAEYERTRGETTGDEPGARDSDDTTVQ
ncbi:MAG: hypothetical protein IT361_12130 [Gemmatimonadaceae bacterium]|nr:hypothetical protein [Gemmatimonadaceae bacterium]